MTTLELILAVLGIILGSAGLFTFLQFLINRRDKKSDQMTRIESKLDNIEQGNARSQLMLLMRLYPENKNEIMMVAEHYFKDLNGDWYLSSLFNSWLHQIGIESPFWFKNHEI